MPREGKRSEDGVILCSEVGLCGVVVAGRAALCRRNLKLVEGKGPCVLVIGPSDVGARATISVPVCDIQSLTIQLEDFCAMIAAYSHCTFSVCRFRT